jgi:hypothetical protein
MSHKNDGRNAHGDQLAMTFRSLGVISSAELYTLAEARARLNWTDSAFRAVKRRGGWLLTCCNRRYAFRNL